MEVFSGVDAGKSTGTVGLDVGSAASVSLSFRLNEFKKDLDLGLSPLECFSCLGAELSCFPEDIVGL